MSHVPRAEVYKYEYIVLLRINLSRACHLLVRRHTFLLIPERRAPVQLTRLGRRTTSITCRAARVFVCIDVEMSLTNVVCANVYIRIRSSAALPVISNSGRALMKGAIMHFSLVTRRLKEPLTISPWQRAQFVIACRSAHSHPGPVITELISQFTDRYAAATCPSTRHDGQCLRTWVLYRLCVNTSCRLLASGSFIHSAEHKVN